MTNHVIKLEGAEFNTLPILKSSSESEFVKNAWNTAYFDRSDKEKTKLLKTVYKIAQSYNDIEKPKKTVKK